MAFEVATPASAGPQRFANYNMTGTPVLPHPAPDRILSIRQAAQDARSTLVPFDQMQDALSTKADIERRIHALKTGGHGKKQDDDSPYIAAEERRLDAATAEVTRLRDLDAARAQRWRSTGLLESRTTDWVRAGPPFGHAWRTYDEDPAPVKGDLPSLISRVHLDIRDQLAVIRRIEAAPYTKAEALEIITKQLDNMAKVGEPYIDGTVETLSEIQWPTRTFTAIIQNLPTEIAGPVAAISQETDVLSLLVWACKDQILAKARAMLELCADESAALSAADRKSKLATAHEELLELERFDSRLTWQARNSAGMDHILFRGDIDVIALLGLEQIKAQPAAPETWIDTIRQSISLGLGGKRDI